MKDNEPKSKSIIISDDVFLKIIVSPTMSIVYSDFLNYRMHGKTRLLIVSQIGGRSDSKVQRMIVDPSWTKGL